MKHSGIRRLDSEFAIMRSILELLGNGVSRDQVERELVERAAVDLDLLSAVIRRIDARPRVAG